MAIEEDSPLALPELDGGVGRRVLRWLVRFALVGACVAGAAYGLRAYRRSNVPAPPRGSTVRRGTLVQSTQATGRVVPRQELFVRPLVSGVLEDLRVRPGDRVRRGDPIATVRIVADPVALGDAQGQARLSQVRLARAQRELERLRAMVGRGLASTQEFAAAQDDERIAREEVSTARSRAQLIAQGSSAARGARSTRVLAPIDGTVLAVPVSVGDYVSETGAFRDGTTIASLADMSDLLFKGQVEEAYVGQLRLEMPVRIRVGAIPGRTIAGTLRWVSPRASVESATGVQLAAGGVVPVLTASTVGVTRFELWASLEGATEGVRAGYSAAAEIELARRENALLIEEGVLRFEGERAYARRCSDGAAGAERLLRVGLSDGVKIELLDGVREGDCLLERAP